MSDYEVKVGKAKSGETFVSVKTPDGKNQLLHSRYDPVGEARKQYAALELGEATHVVLLGVGAGYLLDEILRERPGIRVLAVEPLKDVLGARVGSNPNPLPPAVTLIAGEDETVTRKALSAFFSEEGASEVRVVAHPPSLRLHSDYFGELTRMIREGLYQEASRTNTRLLRGPEIARNMIENLPLLARSHGVRHLENLFPDVPALLVAAGPSLDRNRGWIRSLKQRSVIVAVDTAARVLEAEGVLPDFVVTADPGRSNARYLEELESDDIALVVEPMAHPRALERFGSLLWHASFGGTASRYVEELLGFPGRLEAAGSVSTMAFSLIRLLGCNPVILVGLDQAFTDGRLYASESLPGSMLLQSNPYQFNEAVARSISLRQPVNATDIRGQKVKTSPLLVTHRRWFEERIRREGPAVTVINASEDGILCEGVDVRPLDEVAMNRRFHEISIREKIDKLRWSLRSLLSSRAAASQLKEHSLELERMSRQWERIARRGIDADSLRAVLDGSTWPLRLLEECAGPTLSAFRSRNGKNNRVTPLRAHQLAEELARIASQLSTNLDSAAYRIHSAAA